MAEVEQMLLRIGATLELLGKVIAGMGANEKVIFQSPLKTNHYHRRVLLLFFPYDVGWG